MRTRPCRLVLLSFLCLTTVAASASAEGAWVLWEETFIFATKTGEASTSIEILSGYPTYSLCKEASQQAGDARASEWKRQQQVDNSKVTSVQVEILDGIYAVYVGLKDGRYVEKVRCLPDTIDPRGPKGK